MSELNKSGVTPKGRAVLLQTYQPERKQSLIALPPSVMQNDIALEARATVIALGPHVWHDEPSPRCKVGDRVMVAMMAGKLIQGTLDDQWYRLVNDRDIYATIEEKSNG